MKNSEWIYDCLVELINDIGIEHTDEITDKLTEKSNEISDAITEGYYYSSDYVADCNLKGHRASEEKSEITRLRQEIQLLNKFISEKGFSYNIKNNSIYEVGYEPCGPFRSASYEKEIK